MNDMAMTGNLARVTAAQDGLRRAVERTGSAVQRLDGLFGKAAEAGARLSQVTARPTIAVRDYFSFVIDRLLLQLADLSHTKVDVKLIINDQVIGAAKQLRQLLNGLGGTLSVSTQGGGGSVAEAKASASASVSMITVQTLPPKKSPIDTWIDRLLKIGEAVKLFGEAVQAFGEGIKSIGEGCKSFAEGIKSISKSLNSSFKAFADSFKSVANSIKAIIDSIKSLKGLFSGTGKGQGKGTKCCTDQKTKTKSEAGEKTKSQAGDKAQSQAKDRTRPNVGPSGDSGLDRTAPVGHPNGHPEGHPPASPKGRQSKLFKGGSKLLKGAGRVAAPLGIGMAALDVLTSENKVGAAVQAGAGAGGAALGAALGSVVLPGLGTAVGGMVGGWLGDKVGSFFANKWFSGKKNPEDTASKTSLVPEGRDSVAFDPTQAVSAIRSSGPQAATPNNYDVKVDGVAVNFPKEEVDKEKLAFTIGHQIVSQMNAAMQNRSENGGRAYA
ncbi:hypothetical protein A8709_04650 [Paenibacillus pectinilyticus]|uniref:Phage tail tape measure protein n=1 Tax=Paenibacillus pectinilyticus TaxID=512399 RepID=A0A1C0ZSF0_9BACL|nr:hypothetical protein [Paenibacillus pectinilyticus]OCT10996.1 hypothetical protein A8709_04650 [Paenibacillus pectinilyticus]